MACTITSFLTAPTSWLRRQSTPGNLKWRGGFSLKSLCSLYSTPRRMSLPSVQTQWDPLLITAWVSLLSIHPLSFLWSLRKLCCILAFPVHHCWCPRPNSISLQPTTVPPCNLPNLTHSYHPEEFSPQDVGSTFLHMLISTDKASKHHLHATFLLVFSTCICFYYCQPAYTLLQRKFVFHVDRICVD